jgi:hypothetical protein
LPAGLAGAAPRAVAYARLIETRADTLARAQALAALALGELDTALTAALALE